jgi:hypothetical protein
MRCRGPEGLYWRPPLLSRPDFLDKQADLAANGLGKVGGTVASRAVLFASLRFVDGPVSLIRARSDIQVHVRMLDGLVR